ncbi:hypothetical protein LXA43DRAFT_996669 [Ganoderma leucocontextum]|nr:hypothetical protein LXA43DRAFT_996669 [Ganoderma leucocontextum]
MTPFGTGEEDVSRPGTGGAQVTRNLFVGNLPFHIQWQDLKDLFRQAGAVQRADVALGADGRSRGFGTVSFSNETDAERAVRMFNGYEYNGRPLKVHFDKFAPPASSSAPLVGPTASSAFSSSSTYAFGSPFAYNHAHQTSLSRATYLARELLQSSVEHPRVVAGSLLDSRRSSEQAAGYTPYGAESSTSTSSADQEAVLAALLAQKLALSSPSHQHAQVQSPHQPQFARHPSHPSHIPIPPAIQSPYTFDFLHSGPTTPYDVYDLGTYQRMNAGAGMGMSMGGAVVDSYSMPQEQAYAQPHPHHHHQQIPHSELNGARNGVETNETLSQSRSTAQPAQENAIASSKSASGSTSQPVLPTQNRIAPPARSSSQSARQPQATSPASSSSRSHPTPQQQHHHPAHPGPIALPPPPPVTAFPVPPPHTLSPPYPSPHMHGHPMSPLHHPLMIGMPIMTPHGLPPITPSMPSFTFLPQPSPGLPSPVAPGPELHMYEHMRHVMASYTPFSPGVTMSPGAMWGRPGSGANPFINSAVGAPVHPGQYYTHGYAQQQQPQSQPEQDGGYFPPMTREEPAGYFPWIPPQSDGQTQAQTQRSSGLAREILRERDDSTALTNGSGPHQDEDSPGDMHADSEDASGCVAIRAQACARGGLDVETFVDDSAVGAAGTLTVNGQSSGKPRAYSTQSNGTQGTGSARGSISRADSDPGKKMAVGST